MTGFPVTVVDNGGLPVTQSATGSPASAVASGGIPVTLVSSGGIALSVSGLEEDIWGNDYEEALISPAPSTERSTYSVEGPATVILSRDDVIGLDAGENAPYFPCALSKALGQLPLTFPADLAVYHGSDHSTGNGYLSVLLGWYDAGSPNGILWKQYQQAKDDGDLAGVTGLPSTPYLLDWSGRQLETPWVRWNATDGWMMTAHAVSVPSGYYTQATVRILTTNGFDLSIQNVAGDAAWLKIPQGVYLASGHTGYDKFGPHELPDMPGSVMHQTLASSGDASMRAIWTADNLTDTPTLHSFFPGSTVGRAADDLPTGWRLGPPIPGTHRTTRQGIAALCVGSAIGSGVGAPGSSIYECLYEDDGLTPKGVPILVYASAMETWNDPGASGPNIIDDPDTLGKRLMMFSGESDLVDPDGLLSFAVAEMPFRNPGNTYFDPLPDPIPDTLTETEYDFTAQASLPSGLTRVTSGTTGVSYDANGINLTAQTSGRNVVRTTAGLDATGLDFLEVWIPQIKVIGNLYSHVIFGWATDTTAAIATRIGYRCAIGSTITPSTVNHESQIGGTTIIEAKGVPGLLEGGGHANITLTGLGVRWWPQSGRLCLMQWYDGVECSNAIDTAFLAPGAAVYPYISVLNSETGQTGALAFSGMRTRHG